MAAPEPARLWLALHLPNLSFESWLATLTAEERDRPLALTDNRDILAVNVHARDLGVVPGLKRATALALAPGLRWGRVDAARDRQAFASVAHAALAFTPSVAFAHPETARTVLLQVQGSLRCFGGLAALIRRLRAAIDPLGHTVQLGRAPTALAAAMLACRAAAATGERHASDLCALEVQLDDAPIGLLEAARDQRESLEGIGVFTLGALRRLPRAGVSRRFGEALLDELDRAIGARPDPPFTWLEAPEAFESQVEFSFRADTGEQVFQGAALLVERLLVWARARQSLIQRFTLRLRHESRRQRDDGTPAASTLCIALSEPSCDSSHLLPLLREHLARLELPAPTVGLRMTCSEVLRAAAPHAELFPTARGDREGLARLIERLQARLGPDQVQALAPVADHRPERAVQVGARTPTSAPDRILGGAGDRSRRRGAERCSPLLPVRPALQRVLGHARSSPRPVWLIQPPQPLPEGGSGPVLDGRSLHLLCGPERVEAGWWDAELTERDYFIAQTDDGALVWIYRARLTLSTPEQAHRWFLHGRFA